jgi:cysteinyl-tRNA synthetase
MVLKLHNTLTGKVEEFKPINDKEVGIYTCGPTVYDYIHIGNLRAFFLSDLVRRTFEYAGFQVHQVMNITDVGQLSGDRDEGEDKMTTGLRREGKPITLEAMKELADFYTERFKEDIESLNILKPHDLPKASEHIAEDIELIKSLEEKGFTYKINDGIYFDTSKDSKYGQLGGINLEKDSQARVAENTEKRNKKDFALWKLNTSMGFPSPWGTGFPGWHIECSAMSRKYLGEHFDIHTGGIDLAPIHHNNEIAQSENACGCKFVNYWLHNEFVNISGAKMAKSEGNYITLRTLTEKGYSPLAYRYFLLLSHYKTPTNFTWEALDAAQNAYRKIKELLPSNTKAGAINTGYKSQFTDAMTNDLNSPEALAVVWKLIKDESVSQEDKHVTLLDFDKVLGLDLENNEYELKEIPENIQKIVKEREIARSNKDWKKADELRQASITLGFNIEDTPVGPTISKI